tara:strand:+ start:776 stop:1102 length:327 start_codon:yes stop_codon:yes gene_type:complete
MAIEYEFSRINPLCTCDEDGSNNKTQKIEVSMKASETGAGGHVFEAHANGEILLSGDACVAPEALDLGTLLNDYATANDWKASLAASISSQKAEAHEWTGSLTPPSVS